MDKLQQLRTLVATMDEEPVSKDLEEAAQNWWEKTRLKSDLSGNPINSFKAGAKWKEEQMMKGAVDAEVTYGKSLAIPSLGYFLDKNEMNVGDKVKLILIKSKQP